MVIKENDNVKRVYDVAKIKHDQRLREMEGVM